MRFASPWFLILLPALLLVAWLRRRHTSRPAFLYSSIALLRGVSQIGASPGARFLEGLRWTALVLLILGLARPQIGVSRVQSGPARKALAVVLDVSGSMAAEDCRSAQGRVSRLEAFKEAFEEFLQTRSDVRVGLIGFASEPYLISPPTADRRFLLRSLDRLAPLGTDTNKASGSAVAAALGRLQGVPEPERLILLATDGADTGQGVDLLTAAAAAKALQIPVSAIAVGGSGSAPIPYTDQFGVKRYRSISWRPDLGRLQQAAALTGGKFARAAAVSELQRALEATLAAEDASSGPKRYLQYAELASWCVIPGFVLWLLEIILANSVWRRLP